MNEPKRHDEMAELAGMGRRERAYRVHRPWKHGELLLLPLAGVGGGAYAATASWWMTALIVVAVFVAGFTVVRRIPPRKGLRRVTLHEGGLLLVRAGVPAVPLPWDAIESTEVDHGDVEVKGGVGRIETRERFATITVHLKKKREPLVLTHVVGQHHLAKDIEQGLRPGLLERLRGTLDAEGRVALGGLTVTEAGLELPSPVRGGPAIALGWAELAETGANGLTEVLIRPRDAKDRRIRVRNATVVRDFIEETRSLSG
ncbi:hypothetical protein [Streptomyces sp. NBC_01429]|uniref:hypothetical protein n=1 Tax=Streptomyces sp. NBC_01429 TaxID=2903862 RepID=UPI002E2D6E9D|nr:hypothetical protein [Streptomyces sp. NBC_01429]